MSSTPRLPLELFAIDGMLTEEERAIRDVVRDFVERRIKPEVADCSVKIGTAGSGAKATIGASASKAAKNLRTSAHL